MKDIQRFKNLVDVLEAEWKASPFSLEEWEEQDREIVRLQNAIRHIKNVCQFLAITNQEIIDMCSEAIHGVDIANDINPVEPKRGYE